ncbi:MAG: nuclear transport factor 2 family protein [Methylobacteriaceae bacterium]|nr:nuclear transport factor 2 family protein [Methylobacteriaceae bacterium]
MPESPVFANPAQQEVFSVVHAANLAWTKGDPDDLDQFFHPRMIAFTASDHNARIGSSACLEGWKGFAGAARIDEWRELDPKVELYGDSAVVVYYYDMSGAFGDTPFHFTGRDMFFLVRENGRWLIVADHFSSYPG